MCVGEYKARGRTIRVGQGRGRGRRRGGSKRAEGEGKGESDREGKGKVRGEGEGEGEDGGEGESSPRRLAAMVRAEVTGLLGTWYLVFPTHSILPSYLLTNLLTRTAYCLPAAAAIGTRPESWVVSQAK